LSSANNASHLKVTQQSKKEISFINTTRERSLNFTILGSNSRKLSSNVEPLCKEEGEKVWVSQELAQRRKLELASLRTKCSKKRLFELVKKSPHKTVSD